MVSPKYIKSLHKTATDLDGASKELYQIAKTFEEVEFYNPVNKMIAIVSTLEMATVKARSLTGRLVNKESGYFYEESARVMGISVTEEHDWIKITVPGMLPKRNHKVNNAFLMRPLKNSLQAFMRENPMERFGKCAICIVHKYDEALGVLRVRDYDNIETKRYLDVIESLLLTNDSGLLCTVLQCTEICDRDATEFYLMLPETLPKWTAKQLKIHT